VFELTLEQGYSITTMVTVTLVAVALAAVFYHKAYGMLRFSQWQKLLLLRIVAIVVVILLLFRPTLSFHEELLEKPALVFLLDTSSSMSITDDASGISRFDQARTQLEKWCDQLKDDFRLHLVEFSDRAAPVEEPAQLPALSPKGKSTSLSGALLAASQQAPKKEVAAVFLLSDGIHNSARSPLEVASKLGMVVNTVGVGASLRNNLAYRDIQVTGIDCPDRLMVNNKAKITGMVEGIGLTGRVIKVVLEEDEKQIQELELTLDGVEGSQKVEFEFRPTVKGRHTYTVRCPAIPEEKITENNHRSAIALVVEPGIRVLYIEGTLRGEYGAIVDRFLSKDPDLEFCALIQTRPNVFLKRSNMEGFELNSIPNDAETLNKFDVFIIGDLDASYFKQQQQELIIQRVRNGAGLLMLGGYHALGPGGYAGTPVGEALPVVIGGREIGQVNDSFLPLLTPDGARHPIFGNIAGFFPTRGGPPKEAGLPELDGCTRVQAARPGATVLAVHPTEANQMPVLAVQPLDKGRTAAFCGDTTRKWQQGPRALDQESPFLRFWGQTVRWLAGRATTVEAKASVTSSTDKGYYEPEEGVRISAVVRDDKGEGTANATVVAKVKTPGDPEDVPLTVVPGPVGHYGGTLQPKLAGRYEIVVESRVGQLTVAAEKLVVEVGRPNLEFEKLDMDEKTLSRIASDSGGRYRHISVANSLIEQLDRTQQQKKVLTEWRLYHPPWFWGLFVVVLSLEWILRRRFQLR
jgi:uncharacterized membrane protein